MRLVTFGTETGTAAGVTVDGSVALVRDEQSGQPAYSDVGDLLRDGSRGEELARAALSRVARDAVRESPLRRPILQPAAIVCVGHNYRPHIEEMGRELPASPTLFSKLPQALADPFAHLSLPRISRQVDYEGEVAVVIGRGGREIPREHAWGAVAGLTAINDVTMRDLQRRTGQWFAGKNGEASTPVGPAVVTLDELGNLGEIELTVRVNGERRQSGLFGDLVFDVPTLIEDVSRIFTLRPGDLIATGTPGGVGAASNPPRYLTEGDVVEVEVSGVGILSNRFGGQGC